MTSWMPDLAARRGPRYRAIAEALAEDVRRGALPPGARLPTHRDLAWRLKVTVGTVSRAYAEAERRGLVVGEVGRGTFVRSAGVKPPLRFHAEAERDGFVDLSLHRPRAGNESQLMAEALRRLADSNELPELLEYQPHAGRPAERAAGAAWIARSTGLASTPEQVALTSSAQHAMAVLLAALAAPGEVIAVESLTYPGILAAAALLHVKTMAVACDEHGMLPEALAAAARAGRLRAAYVLPTLHNPTTATMPLERRQALVEVARHHDIMLIEDDLYGFLADAPLPPLAAIAPEQACYITATSKSFLPALRVGYVHCPPALIDRVVQAIRATTYTAPPLMARIASLWIEDGTADRLIADKRAEMARRQEVLRRLLAGQAYRTAPHAAHVWLTLPAAWRAEEFVAAAQRRGVATASAAAFAAGSEVPNALRLCIGTPPTIGDLERGLAILAELLAGAPTPYLAVV